MSESPDSIYRGFEDRFRGSIDEIREKERVFVPIFAGASDVLDIGWGRGGFLALLKEHRIGGRGIDTNAAMIAAARERGLDVTQADAMAHLQSLPDASLGGAIASQVIEHMTPSYLLSLLPMLFRKLRPNAPVVLETINPACWLAFFSSYLRELTHVWRVQPGM